MTYRELAEFLFKHLGVNKFLSLYDAVETAHGDDPSPFWQGVLTEMWVIASVMIHVMPSEVTWVAWDGGVE